MHSLNINVLSNWPLSEAHTVEGYFSDNEKKITILYVPVPRRANLIYLDDILYKLDPILKSIDCIVIRLHKPENNKIEIDKTPLTYLHKRFKRVPIFTLSWKGHNYKLKHIPFTPSFDIIHDKLIKELRYAELNSLMLHSGSLLPNNDEFHYVGPDNKSHYKTFIRVGSILQSADILDSFCFWLLPYIQHNPFILLDSGTILSIGLNIIHYLNECNYFRIDSNWFTKIEYLKAYNEEDESLIERIKGNNNLPKNVLILHSARATGRLSTRLVTICQNIGFKKIDNVVLFGTVSQRELESEIREEIFCHLSEEFNACNQPCIMCSNDNIPLQIQEKTYLLQPIAEAKHVAVSITSADKSKPFFESYPDSGCFSIHIDHPVKKHHMIDIDLNVLIEREKFLERLNETCKKFGGKVDIILTPEDAAAINLGNKVKDIFNVSAMNISHSRLSEGRASDLDMINKAQNILIVDDVTQTGRCLADYQNALMNYRKPDSEIKFLVGVARPIDKPHLDGIRDMVGRNRNNFAYVEEIFLPDWGRKECPWCWELEKMSELGGKLYPTAELEKRYNLLRNTQKGIKENLFLHWSSDLAVKLQHGNEETIFGVMRSELDIFVAVASAIQNMRANNELNLQYTFPVSKVINFEKDIVGRFYECMIRAAILRASKKHDLRTSKMELQQKKEINGLLTDATYAIPFRAEILFAIAQKKLPLVSIPHDVFLGEPGICSFLKHIVESI